jgi:hypothetical protein
MPPERFDEEISSELKAIENALRDLPPSLGQLNRDRLMYLAGQASISLSPRERTGSKTRRGEMRAEAEATPPSHPSQRQIAWPLATAALALVSLTLGGFLLFGKHDEQQTVNIHRATNPLPTVVDLSEDSRSIGHSAIGASYFELRELVLAKGLDAVSMPQSSNEKPALHDPVRWPAIPDELFHGKRGG